MSVPEQFVTETEQPVPDYDPALENPMQTAIGALRDELHKTADAESLLGTTADAVQLILYEFGKMAIGISAATTLAEMRAAAEPVKVIMEPFIAKVDADTVLLPYRDKGLDAVMADIETRATVVANLLRAAAAAAQQS